MEGCSPIRSCSPQQLSYSEPQHVSRSKPRVRVLSRVSPAFISPILNPRLQDSQEVEEQLSCSPSLSAIPTMELDPLSPPSCPPGDGHRGCLDSTEPVKMEEQRVEEVEDEATGVKGTLEYEEEEEGGEPLGQLTSSRMGNVSAAETSHMFISLLTEGSSIRYDSSMQVSVQWQIIVQIGPVYRVINDCVQFRWTADTALPQPARPALSTDLALTKSRSDLTWWKRPFKPADTPKSR